MFKIIITEKTGENAGSLDQHTEMVLQFCSLFSSSVFHLVMLSPNGKEKALMEGKISDC